MIGCPFCCMFLNKSFNCVISKFLMFQVLPLYSEEELQKYVALPNIVFPSDHVALVSDIEWSK